MLDKDQEITGLFKVHFNEIIENYKQRVNFVLKEMNLDPEWTEKEKKEFEFQFKQSMNLAMKIFIDSCNDVCSYTEGYAEAVIKDPEKMKEFEDFIKSKFGIK